MLLCYLKTSVQRRERPRRTEYAVPVCVCVYMCQTDGEALLCLSLNLNVKGALQVPSLQLGVFSGFPFGCGFNQKATHQFWRSPTNKTAWLAAATDAPGLRSPRHHSAGQIRSSGHGAWSSSLARILDRVTDMGMNFNQGPFGGHRLGDSCPPTTVQGVPH